MSIAVWTALTVLVAALVHSAQVYGYRRGYRRGRCEGFDYGYQSRKRQEHVRNYSYTGGKE